MTAPAAARLPCAHAQGHQPPVARRVSGGTIAVRQWGRAALAAFSVALTLALFSPLSASEAGRAATPQADEPDEFAVKPVSDPLGPLNRAVFKFNDGFYAIVLRPVARGYERATPPPLQRGLGNFFENLRFPIRFVGDVLAGRPKRAAQETGKFLVNTTAGFAGLVNVSDSVPALKDVPPGGLGTAFAAWGLGHGPYLVLPVLGPSSVRDGIGLAGDIALIPTNWRAFEHLDGYSWWWRTAIQTTDTVQSSPSFLKTYDDFLKSAVDPYVAVRNGYLQYRDAAVKK